MNYHELYINKDSAGSAAGLSPFIIAVLVIYITDSLFSLAKNIIITVRSKKQKLG
jgi:hypothetical protein